MVKMSTMTSPSQQQSTLPLQVVAGEQSVDTTRSESPQHSPDSASDFSVISNSGSHSPGGVPVVNGTNTSFSHFQDMNLMLNSAVPDMSFEQMQNAFAELLRENLQLKDDVMQSNVAMREQFELMVKLQMHVEGIQKEQTMKHEKARSVIEQLREENANIRESVVSPASSPSNAVAERLQSELTEMRTKCTKQEEEIEHLNLVNHQIKEEMGPLRSDFFQLKSNYLRAMDEKRELAALNADLQAKLLETCRQRPSNAYNCGENVTDSAVNHGFLVVSRNEKAGSDMTLVEKKTVNNLLAQLNDEQNINKELSHELVKQKETIDTLSNQIDGQEEVIRRLVQGGPAAIHQQGIQLISEMRASEDKFSLANSYLQKYRDRCENLESVLAIYQERLRDLQTSGSGGAIDRLRGEIANLQVTLSEEKARSLDEKNNLMEAEQKFKIQFRNHQKLEDNWANFTREQISRGRQSEAYYNLQEKYYQEKVDSLMAKLVTIEDKLASKDDELSKIMPEIQKLKQEAETIPILQTQVDLYKTDFRAEREAREKLYEEKERICEEMRMMQIRHKEAIDTVAQLQTAQAVSLSAESASRHGRRHSHGRVHRTRSSRSPPSLEQPVTSTNTPVRDSPEFVSGWQRVESIFGAHAPTPPQVATQFDRTSSSPEYDCPKCRMKFSELAPLEKHVNDCLDNVDPFVI